MLLRELRETSTKVVTERGNVIDPADLEGAFMFRLKALMDRRGNRHRYWQRVIAAWRRSGLSQAEYCRQNQISSGAECLPGGTLGQNLDSNAAGGGLANGETAWLTQLTENEAFRTNIAATNTGLGTAIVRVTLFGAGGGVLATFNINVPEGEWRQENRPFFTKAGRDDLAAASAKVEVIQGSGVIVAASVVDNITNDPTTLVAIR